MIVEQREYQIVTGKLIEFISLYKAHGLDIQLRHGLQPVGFFTVDIGEVSNFVHFWRYTDLLDREVKRQALHDDPDWRVYVPRSHRYIISMQVRILSRAPMGEDSALIWTIDKP